MKKALTKNNKKKIIRLAAIVLISVVVLLLFANSWLTKKPMTTEEAWEKIYDEDIMTKSHRQSLEKYIDVNAVSNYVLPKQTEEGYFIYPSPMTYTTSYFLGLANCLGIKPRYENTYSYVRSLQMGNLGFSETTGEMCWLYTSYYGANSHKWLDILPRNKSGLVEYIQSFQNEDGGFGNMPNVQSDFQSAFEAVSILKSVEAKPKDLNGAINWMKSKIKNVKSAEEVYKTVYVLNALNYNFSDEEIKLLKDNLETFSLKQIPSTTFFTLSAFEMLNQDVSQFKADVTGWLKDNQKEDGSFFYSGVQSNLYSCQIFSIFNETVSKKDGLINYVNEYELVGGGYTDYSNTPATDYWSVHALSLIGLEPRDVGSYATWTYETGSSGNWGRIVDTYFSLYSLKLLDRLESSEKIINELRKNDNPNLSPFMARYLIPSYMFVQVAPSYPSSNGDTITTYQNKDGGFAGNVGSMSEMYSTFRAIESLHFLDSYLVLKNMEHENWMEIVKPNVSTWIKDSQSKEGGFSWMPGQPAYMQPTYFAVRNLWLLHEKANDIDGAIAWIKDHQNKDGGFNGGVEGTPSDVLHTFYAVGALTMLDDMKKWN